MVSYFFEKISKNHLQKNKNCIQYKKRKKCQKTKEDVKRKEVYQ